MNGQMKLSTLLAPSPSDEARSARIVGKLTAPTKPQKGREDEIKRLRRVVKQQATTIGNLELKNEKVVAESILRRKIIGNALDDAQGWREAAQAELDRKRGKAAPPK